MDIVKHPSSDFQFDFFFWEKISTRNIGRFFYFNNIHHAINITTTNLSLYAAGHHKSRRLSGRIRPPFLFFFFSTPVCPNIIRNGARQITHSSSVNLSFSALRLRPVITNHSGPQSCPIFCGSWRFSKIKHIRASLRSITRQHSEVTIRRVLFCWHATATQIEPSLK